MPALLLRQGRVHRPGPDGPVPVSDADGTPPDPFDVVSAIAAHYTRLYLVDLDGIERGEPQLDFIQEFSRDIALWVDGGVRSSDQSIDILVAGAQRAILSSELLEGPRELQRSWKLSPEIGFEIVTLASRLRARPEWETTDPVALARAVRQIGPSTLVLSSRDTDPDWGLVRAVASVVPPWVAGSFQAADAGRLAETGAAGGIFHYLDGTIDPMPETPRLRTRLRQALEPRDDET